MLRENDLFLRERMEYQKFMDNGGIYTLGTFIPEDKNKVNNNFVQLVPTENTKLMFDTVRNNFGYPSFDISFAQDPTVYTASGKTSMVLVNNIYNVDTHITNMSTEFLDGMGIYLGVHSVRLVELTETNDTYYYVIVGGKGAIEAKADEMYNAKNVSYDGEPFQLKQGQGIALDGISIVDLAIAMANELFGRNWTTEDPIQTQQVFAVDSPHSFDMDELNKWVSLDRFENWTDPVRLGVAFAIKKG